MEQRDEEREDDQRDGGTDDEVEQRRPALVEPLGSMAGVNILDALTDSWYL